MRTNFQILSESKYAKNKRPNPKMTRSLRKVIVELTQQEKSPTIDDLKNRYRSTSSSTDETLQFIFRTIKRKRKEIENFTGIPQKGSHEIKSDGFIYLIENELFDGWIKCGMAVNIESRLKGYNGCDPLKRFKVIAFKAVQDRRKAERILLDNTKTKAELQTGEWFRISKDEVLSIFNSI